MSGQADRRRPVWAMAVLLSLLAVGLTSCSRSSEPAAGRLVVDGRAEVNRPGQDRREVTGSRNLTFGDRVRVLQGTAVVRLPEGRRLELRVGTDVELQAGVRGTVAQPTLHAGDLLVTAGAGPLVVAVTGADVAVQGDARLSRGLAMLVGAYKGTVQMSSNGSTLTVPALRQAAIPAAGPFPTKAAPLEALATDPWDLRYLSDAIQLSNQLAARSDGFTAQLGPTEGRSFNYFRELLPRLAAEPGFTPQLLNPARPPGETLVGAAITLEGSLGAFAERWAAVFGFRDLGAAWGLVAADQGVAAGPLMAAIESAIARGPAEFAVGPPGKPPSSLAPPSSGSATTSAPTTTSTTAPARPRPGATTTTATPGASSTTTSTLVGPLNTGSPLIDDTINSLVNTLTGLLRSLGGQQ